MKKLLVFVVLLAAGAGAAYHFGYLQRLLPDVLEARLIPKDAKLLAYFGPDTHELAVLQLTEAHFPLSEEAQQKLAKSGREFYDKTGIDIRKDVDAVAGADGLGVARGRFDWEKLGPYLQSEGYTLTQLSGVPAAVKARSVDVALDGHYLLMGPRSALVKALERKRGGKGLEDGSPLVKALDEVGWKHALVGGVVSGSRLSPQEDLKVQSAVGALDMAPDGFELHAVAFTANKEQGEALLTALEVMRKAAIVQLALIPKAELHVVQASLESSKLANDDQGRVRGTLRFPYTLVDQASANLSEAPLASSLASLQFADEGEDSEAATPPATVSPQPAKQAAPPAAATVSHHLDWKPPVFGVVLLVLALVTMGAKSRPGMFNVLLHPLFLLPFLVATLGVFVLRWTAYQGATSDLLQLPMPEWHRFLSFSWAQPVGLSAAIPMVFALVSGAVPLLRRCAAGLAVGFSAYLATAALMGTSVAMIPPAYKVVWLAGNAVAALLMARLTIPGRMSKKPPAGRPA